MYVYIYLYQNYKTIFRVSGNKMKNNIKKKRKKGNTNCKALGLYF